MGIGKPSSESAVPELPKISSEYASPETYRPNVLRSLWNQWWFSATLWLSFAITLVRYLKHEPHKCMLSFLSNCFICFPIIWSMHNREAATVEQIAAARGACRSIFFLAFLMGLERNLTNSAMYKIGG